MSRRNRRSQHISTDAQMRESLVQQLRVETQHYLQEATSHMLERMKEDLDWHNMAADARNATGLSRAEKVEWSRSCFEKDPFVKRSVYVPTEFTFGSGIDGPRAKPKRQVTEAPDPSQLDDPLDPAANKAEDPKQDVGRPKGVPLAAAQVPEPTDNEEPQDTKSQKPGAPIPPQKEEEAEDPDVEFLREFWDDDFNQATMFSQPMQVKRSLQLLLDGDLFLTLSQKDGQPLQIRKYPTLDIEKLIMHPEDNCRVLYYAAPKVTRTFNTSTATYDETRTGEWVYFKDYRNTNPEEDPLEGTIDAPDDVWMMHISINNTTEGGFGEPEVLTSLKWLNGNRRISEDQGTISRATAALMNILQARSTSSVSLAGLQKQLDASSGGQAPLPGAINMLNGDSELKVNRVSTQASDAWQNTRIMRVPAATGVGLALHFLGDPENANLATTSSMELPILRHLECYQSLWRWVYGELCDLALKLAGKEPKKVRYDISMSPILEDDIAKLSRAIIDGESAGFLTADQAAQKYMEVLNLDDIPTRMQELNADKANRETKDAMQFALQMKAMDTAAVQPPGGVVPNASARPPEGVTPPQLRPTAAAAAGGD